jgi:hypothetical protein
MQGGHDVVNSGFDAAIDQQNHAEVSGFLRKNSPPNPDIYRLMD